MILSDVRIGPKDLNFLPLPWAIREPTKFSKGPLDYRGPSQIWEPNAIRIRIQNKSVPEMYVARQRGAIWIAPLCSSDPCPITVMAFPIRLVGVWPPLHRTSLFTGPSQTIHSSGLAAKGQTSPARTYYDTRRVSQQRPCKHSPPTPSPPLPFPPCGSQPHFSSPA